MPGWGNGPQRQPPGAVPIRHAPHLPDTVHWPDGRWLAEVPELPGVLAYGATVDEAVAKAEVLALRVLAERLEPD